MIKADDESIGMEAASDCWVTTAADRRGGGSENYLDQIRTPLDRLINFSGHHESSWKCTVICD